MKEHPLKRLLTVARQHRKRVWLAGASSVLNKIFDLAPPALIGAAVDTVVEREDSLIASFGVTDAFDQLVVLAAVTVVIWALESAFEYAAARLWRNLAQTIQHDLRQKAYEHIQDLELKFFHEKSTGSLMAILNDDVNQLERFLDEGANDLLQVATTAIVICGAFFVMAPGVAWMAMLPIPIVLWGSFKFQRLLAPKYARVRERVASLNSQLSNNLSGIATIKSFATEAYESKRIEAESRAYEDANRDAIKLASAFSPLIRMAIVVGFVATLVYGGVLVLDEKLAVGTYSVMVFLTQRLLWPLTRLGRTFDTYQRAMASTQRILDLLETPIEIQSGGLRPEAIHGEIEFQGVDFGYPNRENLLNGFDLKIPAGATLGVVGATGSGKTTLINLLLRFYDPRAGKILVDGTPIEELELDALRRAIGLVSQHVFLFHGTVEENIRYGSEDATLKEIEEVARQAEAMEFVEKLPLGLKTIVGERGETLSGGQRQRISIARALLKNPPILILDEATSAVDNETEAAIQRSLEKISKERTTLIVAHRLSTVRRADSIIVMEHGKITEHGTHEELVDLNGTYARLWRVQTGE
ncbi:ABC transporter ATP-binding protein [Microvenator marinus]|uniref:ABC transporter ATP-binding protein n=1 Tax=Microvenator marinus TaxID=2600177 RepID=A0A5B8XUY5_9DELT|nr:ABC transporter ATP-binding protein [Microvenator marinus]QED29752.1 ABC transporter ATP-binding protein [Microvenator marinus]